MSAYKKLHVMCFYMYEIHSIQTADAVFFIISMSLQTTLHVVELLRKFEELLSTVSTS